jgi:hypothetical protein
VVSTSYYPFDRVSAKFPDTNDAPTIEEDTSWALELKRVRAELEDEFIRSKRGEIICKGYLINTREML